MLIGAAALAAFLGSRKTRTAENGEERFEERTGSAARGEIREKMEVVGSDGARVGTIDHIKGSRIQLTRKDSADGQHHFISTDSVASIDGNKVTLTQTADAANRNESGDDKSQSAASV